MQFKKIIGATNTPFGDRRGRAYTQRLSFLSLVVALAASPLTACAPSGPSETAPGEDVFRQLDQSLTDVSTPKLPPPAVTTMASLIAKAKAELAAKNVGLRIVSYAPLGALSTDADVQSFKTAALADAQVIPDYDNEAQALQLTTISQRMTRFKALSASNGAVSAATAASASDPLPAEVDVKTNIKTTALPAVARGQGVLKIVWDSDELGRFETRCAYDASGLQYDSIMTNFAFVESDTSSAPVSATGSASSVQAADVQAAASKRVVRRTLANIYMNWLWGKRRGEAVVTQTVTIDSKKGVVGQDGGGSDWISVGKSDHQYRSVFVKASSAKMAGAAFLSTPTVSFRITYDSSKAKFVISSSGIGSRVRQTNESTVYR